MRCLLPLLFALACTPPDPIDSDPPGDSEPTGETGDSWADTGQGPGETGDSSGETGLTDTGDTGEIDPGWGEGPLTIRGRAYFFDMPHIGQIDWIRDVEGAEVHVFEAPELRVTIDPEDDHSFEISGIPEGVEITLAVVHDDYYPHLSGTFTTGDTDIEGVTFQAVSHTIAFLAGGLLGADPYDGETCQMATTVTAAGAEDIWAVGEPGAIVTLDPEVPLEQGPYYFDESVIPDPTLTETTSDGGVTVVGATPGVYTWSGHKEGVVFEDLTMRCEIGWITNPSPPWGMNVLSEE
jgi:hypothetical protein